MAHLVQGFTYKKWWCSIAIHSYLQLPKDIISSSIRFSSDYILGCIGKYANFNAKLCWLCSELPLWQGFTQQNHTKSYKIHTYSCWWAPTTSLIFCFLPPTFASICWYRNPADLKQIPEKVPSFLQLRPWLLLTSGYFYGIIHEPYMGFC